MDEPLSNLDAKLRVSTRAQIKNLSHELKTTTIYVTHDQIEAMTLADRVVVMKGISVSGLPAAHSGSITLGFRAEDASVADSNGQANSTVYSLELLGEATMVTMRAGGTILSVKSGKDYRTKIGDPVSVSIPAAICHLFNSETGERLA